MSIHHDNIRVIELNNDDSNIVFENLKFYELKGKQDITVLLDKFTDNIEENLKNNGFSIKAQHAVRQFIDEIRTNAIKARGSLALAEKYGTFDNLFLDEPEPKKIINDTITQYENSTIVRLWFNLENDKLIIKLLNNTHLNEYLENRIKAAFEKSCELSIDDIEKISSGNGIYGTKASGAGLGIPMLREMIREAGGCFYFNKVDCGWTMFAIEMNK